MVSRPPQKTSFRASYSLSTSADHACGRFETTKDIEPLRLLLTVEVSLIIKEDPDLNPFNSYKGVFGFVTDSCLIKFGNVE